MAHEGTPDGQLRAYAMIEKFHKDVIELAEAVKADTGGDTVVYLVDTADELVMTAMPRARAIDLGAEASLPEAILAKLREPAGEGHLWIVCIPLDDEGTIACVHASYGLMSRGGDA